MLSTHPAQKKTCRLSIVLAVALISGQFGTACGYHSKNQDYSQLATVKPTFSSISAGIITPKCMPCHNPTGGAPDFSNYKGVFKRIEAGSADRSSFYTALTSGSMPVDRPMLSDDDILAVYQWIQAGAQND